MRKSLLLIALAAMVPYAPFLGNPFTSDDRFYLMDDPFTHDLRNLGALTSPDYFKLFPGPGWRPLASASHIVDHALWGLAPAPRRAPNLLAHGANSVLLFLLARSLTGRPDAALAAGLLFALHPVHSETIFEAIFRADSVATLGVLLALLLYRRWEAQKPFLSSPAAWGALAALVVGAGFKEGALVLVPLLWLHDRLGLLPGSPPRAVAGEAPRVMMKRLVPFLAFTGAYAAFRVWGLPGQQTVTVPGHAATWGGELGVNLLTLCKSLTTYVRLAVWPYPLALSHDIVPAGGLEGTVVIGLAVLVAWSILIARSWRFTPLAAFGLAWAGLAYLPTANLAPGFVAMYVAERYAYLPSAGLALAAADWLARRPPERLRRWRPAFEVLLLLYGGIVLRRGWEWRDPRWLFELDVSRQPDTYLAHYSRGLDLHRLGRLAEARAEYETAIKIETGRQLAHYQLGGVALFQGDLRRARDEFEWMRRRNPRHPGVYLKLGHVERLAGRPRLAEAYYKRALDLDPSLEEARKMLANRP